ncbi:tRNA(Ile)-lysidine synthetase [Sphingobium sp. 22B]|uniref:tRNA lysidine(34) synthetase TilS n=1 Tax=unclassified Sphingobium TaxID=2611147 RepID=UPI000782790C|nr:MULTISPECIES: tRNA lysidine(34) synthetase TilS [unclassified Sphingobium]KXU31600.1 tRNA(Ile)-lysidine synthetase [Sphingobium sp. AM]KYC33492.1 tRNA(Ile)-lysidine synthetase [Sphingobium sp. 22B]OAP32674.1 tRNA lysidine(34) synthetase TilS [Sphingobium sp. 20006FA]
MAEGDPVAELSRAMMALVGDADGARFGVAVSGGPDSMALLDLAARAFPGRVEAATVDHGLREASAAEAAMVADWCAGAGIAHATLHPTGAVRGNVQSWARAQRYRLLEGWRAARGLDWLLTAHHGDDQLETLLMRLNRGAGVGGLAGVRARQGVVLRPLLGVRKADLLAYALERGLPHVDDPSNSDSRFDRAALRIALAGVDWIDAAAAGRSAAALAEAEEALDWTVDDLEARHVHAGGGGLTLDRTDLPRELLRRLILRMIARLQPDAAPPRGEAVDRLVAAARRGEKMSIGRLILKGGACWTLTLASQRRWQ